MSPSIPLDGVLPPLGVVPVGLGDGAGDCHDVANLPKERLLISLWYLSGGENFILFSESMVS